MSKFFGRRFIGSGLSDGYHSGLLGLGEDDHPQYLITSGVRYADSPASGIIKTNVGPGDVFTIQNPGIGSALYIQQTGDTNDAYAAVNIDNTSNVGRGLFVQSDGYSPNQPLVQFSSTHPDFDEPVLLITHGGDCGLALEIQGDAYVSCQLEVGQGVSIQTSDTNPFALGDSGIYVKSGGVGGEFYFVDATGNERTWGGGAGGGDGYLPFIEVDEVEIYGASPAELENTMGYEISSGAIIRRKLNDFLIGAGNIELRGFTLRSPIDGVIIPDITYTVWKNALVVNENRANTLISGGTVIAAGQPTTEVETFNGGRKESVVQFTTGQIDMAALDGDSDGYYIFVFSGTHTLDTKTISFERRTQGPEILGIDFDYPTCGFSGIQQTAVTGWQTFDVTVTTDASPTANLAVSVEVQAGGAIQSAVSLTEGPAGTWTGTVTASSSQGNGLAEITVEALDISANPTVRTTVNGEDDYVVFDNDAPVIEGFSEGDDVTYPAGQSCLKYGEIATIDMVASDFTEILYNSPNGRFSITNPTTYEQVKTLVWDLGASGIEENSNILGSLTTTNLQIRARKASNCTSTTRNIQIRLDDTTPRITSIRWTTNCSGGSYDQTSPVLGLGTHQVRFIFNDPLVELPTISILDGDKGTLAPITGAVPGTTFFSTVTIDGSDTEGCTEFVLDAARNCSNKQPLDADPIDGADEAFCVDILSPNIISVELDIDTSDGYLNGDAGNLIDDDSSNQDNTEQACEVDFSSGVQSITARDVLTRHGEDVTVTVQMDTPIPVGGSFNDEVCTFSATPWGGGSINVPRFDNYLFQGTFTTSLGATRTDDQGAPIGRASIWHATGNSATVEDTACNTDTSENIDVLSANGIDDIADDVLFVSDGTATPSFQVSTSAFRAFMPGRRVRIVDDNTAATIRTVVSSAINGTITVDGGSLESYTTGQNARAVPLGATTAEVAAWDTSNGLVAYVNDGAFTQLCVCDWANPEAFSQHLSDDQLTQNNSGTVGVDLFRAAFWGSKLSVPNTNGGTEDNPTASVNSTYVWRSKRMRLTTNPAGVQGSNVRFMLFGFLPGTAYRNVPITSAADWDTNSSRYNLNNTSSQIDIRISVDDPFAATPPLDSADWFDVTDFQVSPQSGFKFGSTKDLNIVFSAPATDVIDKDIYVEIALHTDASGKAPQVDLFAFAFLA